MGNHIVTALLQTFTARYVLPNRDCKGAATESPLKRILQRELNQSRIHTCARDHAESGRCRDRSAGVVELRMIERVEEFRPELQRSVLPDSAHHCGLDDRHIPIELGRPEDHSHAGITVVESVPDGRRSTKRARREVSDAAAGAAQPILDAP